MAPRKPKKEVTAEEAMRLFADFARKLELGALGGGGRKPTPLQQAQDLYYEACDAATKAERISLAKQAIAISPLCADAYALLAAYEEKGSDRQLELFRAALNAGRKAIGRKFKEYAGGFWGWHETRPFMRAKLALAHALWERNERAECLTHFREMLELNPGDNQGVRSIAAAYLIEEHLWEEAAALLERYKDDSGADLAFSRALLAFALHGDCAASRKALAAANAQNGHVREYLLGRKKLPKILPDYYSPGDASEAEAYLSYGMNGWRAAPEAIEWLAGASAAQNKPAAKRPTGRNKAAPAG